jgi:hypothetical protein
MLRNIAKRIFIILLMLILILSIFSLQLDAATETCEIILVPRSLTLNEDGTIDIEIRMSNVTSTYGFASYSGKIIFDTKTFTYDRIVGYGEWETPEYNNGNIVATSTSGNGQATDQIVAVLTLKANTDISDGRYSISMSNIKVSNGVTTLSIPQVTSKITIDREAPIINTLTESTAELTNQKVTLTVEAKDELSGLDDAAYSWDGQQTWSSNNSFEIDENGTYTIYVKDKAGNISNNSITISNIYKIGDINNSGDIEITDLLLLKRHIIAGDNTSWILIGQQEKSADINSDENIDVTDLILLKRHIVAGNKEEWKIK